LHDRNRYCFIYPESPDHSEKHTIVSNAPNGVFEFCFSTRKVVMPKKKVIASRNLKDWTKFTTQINETTRKKFLKRNNFELPEPHPRTVEASQLQEIGKV